MNRLFLGFMLGMIFVYGCKDEGKKPAEKPEVMKKGGNMKLTSAAFENGAGIPAKYTADGINISPPLKIENVPRGTESFALVVDDPDAPMGTWDHWILWNIPPHITEIGEGITPESVSGRNDFGKMEYGGPAPPSGTHRYFFKLYALDTVLGLEKGATKKRLEAAMEGHILEKSVLTGNYSR